MRRELLDACVELSHVVVAAKTPSTSMPRAYVQDPKGGDFSAMVLLCSGARHCAARDQTILQGLREGALLTVRGRYKRNQSTAVEELRIDELIDEAGEVEVPPAVTLTVEDAARERVSSAHWFQRARLVVPNKDPLVPYDFSPAELQLKGPCPLWGGFAMIQSSRSKAPAAACSAGANPAGVSHPDEHALLIGRQFFDAFPWSTDCACAGASGQRLMSPEQRLSGALFGVLTRESQAGRGYQIFQPFSVSECSEYEATSVTEMRTKHQSGCFELSGVTLARTPSTLTPRLYVQDLAGGDFSAMVAACRNTASHVCSNATAQNVLALLNGFGVKIRGYYDAESANGMEELLLDEVVDQGMLLPVPAPARPSVSDLARAERTRAAWFQLADVQIPADDPLVLYDLSPREMKLRGPCPAWGGFGLIPLSAGTAVPADCMDGRNPPSIAKPDAREVLIGRQFFDAFSYSTDCACAAASKQHLLTSVNFVAGTMRGILTIAQDDMSATAYQVFQPLSRLQFPVQ